MLCNHLNTVGAWYSLCLNLARLLLPYPVWRSSWRPACDMNHLRCFSVPVYLAAGSVGILELFAFTLMKSVSYVYLDFPCVHVRACVCEHTCVCLCTCTYLCVVCVSVCCASSVSSTYPPSPFQSFSQYIQLSSLWCLSNKTVPSTALEWISLIISFRLLLCLKTWGPGRQEEKNVNLQGVPVVCWEHCLGEAKKLPLDLLMAA